MNRRRMLAAILLLTAPVLFAGQVYKWKDAQGRVHYGDKPADGAEKIEVNAPASQIQLQKERENELATSEKTAKLFEECKRSKEQLETYKNASSVIRKDGLGGEKELDATERAKLIQITEQRAKDACAALPPPE